MSYDPDDTRWAARAAEIAATHTIPEQAVTVARTGQFMNPWHDEIGRFAPKGTGHHFGKITRELEVPDTVGNAATLELAQALLTAVRDDPLDTMYHQSLMSELMDTSENADPDLLDRLIKPAARAIGDEDFDEAQRLLDEAKGEVFSPFLEEFEIPEPEHVEVNMLYDDRKGKSGLASWNTTTPEGNTITFKNKGHDVSDEQIQTILSAATTAARAGNLTDVDIEIVVEANIDEDGVRNERVLGFVNADSSEVDTTTHRTVHVTPELINGNFEPDGVTPLEHETLSGSGQHTDPLRMTVIHEMGHVSLFEEALVRQSSNSEEWFNDKMTDLATQTPGTDMAFMSTYATQNTVEMHAEAFAEWTNTGGTTNNPWVRRTAEMFGWSSPAVMIEQREPALVAAGPRSQEPIVPIWLLPDGPVTLIDGVDGANYIYGEDPLTPGEDAEMAELSNLWQDDDGQFAPRGTTTHRQFRLTWDKNATIAEFGNPWHDEIGRFAPKGTGTRYLPDVGNVDEYLAAHPRLPDEAIFVWHGRLVDGLPPATKDALLFEIRERYEPVDYIVEGAKRWRAAHDLPEPQIDISEVPANLTEAYVVARLFENTPDQSGDPKVQSAFAEFKRQNADMYDFMTRPESEGGMGVKVEFWTNDNPQEFGVGPYPDATAQAADLRENHHIFLEAGLGGEHQATMTQQEYDQFRAVHDVFGHAGIGGGFDRHGEYEAYLAHSTMYEGDGRRAMASEYHGVNTAMWAGEPGTPGSGKSILLPEKLVANPWTDSGTLRPDPPTWILEGFLPNKEDLPSLVAAPGDELDADEIAAAITYLIDRAGIQHPFAQMYDDAPMHRHSETPADPFEQATISRRAFGLVTQFANPWHDEIGRFAPKGTGSATATDGDAGAPKSATTIERVARFLDDMPDAPPEVREAADSLKGAAEAEDADEFEAWMEEALAAIVRAGGTDAEMLDIEDQLEEIRRAGFTIGQFANPWHDEAGRFAPKGAGTKSDGTPDAEAPGSTVPVVSEIPGEAKLEVKPGGNRTTGVDAKALADEVINGQTIVVNAIDADDVIRNMADSPQAVVDLTAVTVEGAANMFSQMRESGRARTEMPQITPDVQSAWFDTLRQEGIAFVTNEVDPAKLAATQSELNGKKVGGMIRSMENGSMSLEGDPLLVSSDGHILDGHHRWAAAAAMSADCGGCIKIPVVVIALPIAELVPMALDWTDARGIPRAGVGDPSKKKAAAGMSPWVLTMTGMTFGTNFMDGGTPVPDGEYPKFATDAEDGITDADMVGLPQGDGSLRDSNAATAGSTAPDSTQQSDEG